MLLYCFQERDHSIAIEIKIKIAGICWFAVFHPDITN